ncbi:MAG: hypothetical protein IPH93_17200 [Saprospiraceae bacterium]|nr:hypothetical protein [Saprospiraceae bacterium]MBK7811419.1 hypothetical protein [Saprospiraceae bacterium]MBK9631331.1 hypothetical protein [Saprospiraceae bacterium]
MPYGRNENKYDLLSLFSDQQGTCSTKHAILKTLANENDFLEIQLVIGLFKMNVLNTPQIQFILDNNHLNYIPEAHCYLKYRNNILDYTKSNSNPSTFFNDLIEEIEISPDQITDFKVSYHQNYLKSWILENSNFKYSFSQLWEIREQCIQNFA